MPYCTHIPQAPLADFVDLFWFYEGPRPAHSKERVPPWGTMQIVISLVHLYVEDVERGSPIVWFVRPPVMQSNHWLVRFFAVGAHSLHLA
jgi:hypothetical protein